MQHKIVKKCKLLYALTINVINNAIKKKLKLKIFDI